jgi:hypothetical protein
MKTLKLLFAILAAAGLIANFNSCTEDDLTEQERLELLDSLNNLAIVNYSVTVVSAADNGFIKSGTATEGLLGATVEINHGGNISSATTNDFGIAVFSDMRAGSISVSIHLDGYTDVTYLTNLTPEAEMEQNYTYASTIVPLFPVTGEGTATISGKVASQSDLTNLTKEQVTETDIFGRLVTDATFMNTYFPNNAGPGSVVQVNYSSAMMKTTTDSEGNYTLIVPASVNGLDILIDITEFETDQQIVLETLNGEEVNGIQTVRTIFGNASVTPTFIPVVPGAYVSIGPPTSAVGYYSQAAILANPVIAVGVITEIDVLVNGSGYTNAPNVIITGDGSGATAIANVVGGEVNSILVTNGGSGYTFANASLYITLYHEQATATANISAGGYITGINIINIGEGYIAPPAVTITSNLGVGSGAQALTTGIGGGSINTIVVTNAGSDYRQQANFPAALENSSLPAAGLEVNVLSGKTYIKDIYLGTGKRTNEN